jgi:ABC-2 type transport system permease protein
VTVLLRFLKDRRRLILWWCVGLGAGVLLSIAFYPSFKQQGEALDEMMKDLPEGLKALAGAQGSVSLTSPEGFLNSQVFVQVLPIALLVLAIGAGARAIAGAEDDGTLELLLANPVTRVRVAVERYIAAMLNVIIVALVASAVLVGLGPVFELDIPVSNYIGACAAVTCFAILHGTIAFAVGAIMGGRGMAIAVSSAIAVGGFILFGLVSGDVLEPLRFITPWWWYLSRNILARGLSPEAIGLPLGLSAALFAVGVNRFAARDLKSAG